MWKPDRRLEVLLWVAAFVAIVLAGRYLIPAEGKRVEEGKLVRIGYVSWAEGVAMTHLAQVILEDRLGYRVDLTLADPAPIFTSLAEGNLDFFLDAWLPLTHKRHMEKYGDVLVDLGYNYEDARIGLVVPSYVDIESIPQLAKNTSVFNKDITGIDSGAGIMEATRRAIEAYNLDMNLLTSSGAAMTASLKDAVAAGNPIVVTGWKPHWMFARWELKFLADPRKVYGEEENLHTVARPGISQDMPKLVAFFKEFYFTDRQIGTLMDAMNRFTSQEEAAQQWIEDHESLVESWVEAAR
jgi:glycine betaine/proline transport system substrate-binding protein